jgi:Zinc finger C-x8-C-x5-C-x3-H type (and similar)
MARPRPRRSRMSGDQLLSQEADINNGHGRRRPCKFFFANAKCLKGESCPYSHDLLEIGFGPAAVEWLEAQWLQDRKFFQKMALDHPIEKWFTQRCSFYNRGYCDRGLLCTFIHEEDGDENLGYISRTPDVHEWHSPPPGSLNPASAAFTPSTASSPPSFGTPGSKVRL